MGKKTSAGKAPRGGEEITSTKVRAELIRKANMVVLHRKKGSHGFTLFDYLDSLIADAIERDYAAMIADESKRKP